MKLAEFGEDQTEPRLHLLIGIENDLARAIMRSCVSPEGKGRRSSPCAALTFALMEALPDMVQLRLAHYAGQTEQQAVMVSAGIVETFAVGNDNVEERAQIEELMPVAVVAGKPGRIEADDEVGIAQADLGDQILKAHPLNGPGSGFAEIFIHTCTHSCGHPVENGGSI